MEELFNIKYVLNVKDSKKIIFYLKPKDLLSYKKYFTKNKEINLQIFYKLSDYIFLTDNDYNFLKNIGYELLENIDNTNR